MFYELVKQCYKEGIISWENIAIACTAIEAYEGYKKPITGALEVTPAPINDGGIGPPLVRQLHDYLP